MNKKEKRQELLMRRASVIDRENKNRKIKATLIDLIDKIKPESIFCYVSMGSEVDTKDFIIEYFGKCKIFVPYTHDNIMVPRLLNSTNDLSTDKLGNIDLIYLGEETKFCPITIVPMVGFNSLNKRMGYGGGYYDKYLASNDTFSLGLAYEEQFEKDLPTESHDVGLNIIITQNGVRLCE